MTHPGWPLQSDWFQSPSSKAFSPTSRRPAHRDWPGPIPPQSGRFPVHLSELEKEQEERESAASLEGDALKVQHLQLDDRFQRVCFKASSLTSVQNISPSAYRKSTAAASTRSLTTTADSPRAPPASTNRTSRRLANRRRGKPEGKERFKAPLDRSSCALQVATPPYPSRPGVCPEQGVPETATANDVSQQRPGNVCEDSVSNTNVQGSLWFCSTGREIITE